MLHIRVPYQTTPRTPLTRIRHGNSTINRMNFRFRQSHPTMSRNVPTHGAQTIRRRLITPVRHFVSNGHQATSVSRRGLSHIKRRVMVGPTLHHRLHHQCTTLLVKIMTLRMFTTRSPLVTTFNMNNGYHPRAMPHVITIEIQVRSINRAHLRLSTPRLKRTSLHIDLPRARNGQHSG